jgi:hypothetical protein
MQQGAAPVSNPQEVRKALQEILDQRQFTHLSPNEGSSDSMERLFSYAKSLFDTPCIKKMLLLMERLTAPILDFLKKNIGHIFSSNASWHILLALSVILMIGMIILILRTLRRNIVHHAETNKDDESPVPGDDLETSEEKAAINERNGDYVGALRNLYHALLLFLDEKKIARFDESSTNGEIETELRQKCSNEAMELFRHCTLQFERILYADASASESQLKRFRENYDSFKRMVA